MSKNEVIENLNELIELKNVKIAGMQYAIDVLKKREAKALRELGYLKAKYDSADERRAIDSAIEVVKKSYEQI